MSASRFDIVIPSAVLDVVDAWDKGRKSKFIKVCRLASVNLFHPSLNTKKVNLQTGEPALRCRVDDHYRVHFDPPAGGQLKVRDTGPHRLEGMG